MSKQSRRGSAWNALRLKVLERDGFVCGYCQQLMAARTFKGALLAFVKPSPWLDESHEAELMALRFLAETFDNGTRSPAPLVAQWGLTLRGLKKQAPGAVEEDDALEAMLKAQRQ